MYENHEDFSALPTYFVIPALNNIMSGDTFQNVIPGKEINLASVLHGEQFIEILGELPTEGVIDSKCKVVEVLDKGSGAAIVVDVESYNESGELFARNQTVIFAIGAGKFGGPRASKYTVPCIAKPSRAPDASLSQKTSVDQAALYRLSGDLNPIHIDPSMAAIGGFDVPILHGLCTFGFSVRLVLKQFAGNDSNLVKAIKVCFLL